MARLRRGQVTKGGEQLPGGRARGIKSWRNVRPIVADLVLTVAATALSLGVLFGSPVWPHVPVSRPAIALTLLGTLPLVARRRWPLAVLAIVALAAWAEALYLAAGSPDSGLAGVGLAVALYTVASRIERHTSLRLAGLIAA